MLDINYMELLLWLRSSFSHCEKPRSGDEAISTLPRWITSLPTVARNDQTAECPDFQIDIRIKRRTTHLQNWR